MNEQKTILLIEDNPEMRENTAEILSLSDYDVLTAENGKVGVSLAQQESPDLIICDVMMPELDGFGVLRILSKMPSTANIPFIFLTAKAEMADLRKGMNLGADDYLTKPFDDVELLDAIEIRLKKSAIVQQEFEANIDGLNHFFSEARGLEALQELSKDRESRIYKTKDIIFSEGSYPHGLLFVNSGKVKTYKTNEDAKDYITGLYKAGDFLGHIPMLADTPYQDSAMALEDTVIYLIPKDDFFSLMYNNRDVSNRFVKMLSSSIMDREEQLLHLAYDSVRKRVADALLTLEARYKEEQLKNGKFSMDISRENLANMVGTSKECVIRVLSEFRDDGILETRMSNITLLNPEELSRVRY
ncbi:MAG: response regulator [Bacteroidota bacterium]